MLSAIKEKTIRFLRWSEQYTRTDMVYLIKGGFWTWFGKVASIAASLGLSIAFANLIPSDTYGTYKYIVSLAGVMSAFTLSGMGKALTRAVAQGFEGMYQKGARAVFRWSGGIVLVAGGSAAYYLIQGNQEIGISLILVAGLYPFIKSGGLYKNFLEGKKEFKSKSIYLIIREVIQAGVLIGLMLITHNTIFLILGLLGSNAALSTFFYFYTKQKYLTNEKEDNKAISFGKHLSVIQIIRSLATQLDKLLVFQFLGSTPLAVYSFAQIPVKKADSFLRSIGSIILPKFSEKSLQTLQRTIARKAMILFAFCVLSVGIFIITAPFIYQLIFPEYIESIGYARLFSLMLLAVPEILYGQALYAHALTKELYIVNVGSSVLKICLLAILLPLYGIIGAITAIISVFMIRFFAKMYYFYTANSTKSIL